MPMELTQVARDRAPAREHGVDGDLTRCAVELGEPTTLGKEIA